MPTRTRWDCDRSGVRSTSTKFRSLADGVVTVPDQQRFIAAAEHLATAEASDLAELFPPVEPDLVADEQPTKGLF